MKTTQLSLETRKQLSMAALTLKQPPVPPVFVVAKPGACIIYAPIAKVETHEQAELRRARVRSITRQAPEVVITRRWIHTTSHFDAKEAVVMKLPVLQRIKQWLRGE